MVMAVLLLLAYRAILAEPRSKTTATEDYTAGTARTGDYTTGGDSVNQYAFPVGTHLFHPLIYDNSSNIFAIF